VAEEVDSTESESAESGLRLWSDDPADVDLLSFSAISATIVDALLDDDLDPLAVGLSGSWGSGKTTVLRLIQQELKAAATSEKSILVVSTDPWRYDPTTGAKETLIAEVLQALKNHLESAGGDKQQALALLKKLAERVDWARAVRIAAKGALAFQVPSFEEVVKIIRPAPEKDESPPGLDAFRAEFEQLMDSEALADVRRVVVLVDDLDRCLPETVIDTLEAIRLFLAVPKMSFVIAADEQRVAEAIRTRFEDYTPTPEAPEEPAALYLHKIVQTTVPIPALSRFDTEAYLILLQILTRLGETQRAACIEKCTELRRSSGELDELAATAGEDISKELLFAARLTPILYEKLRGNPRRIKRFLNDLNVRQSIATRRGIKLDPEVVAKLMVLEVLLPDAFSQVLDWLARNELRDRIAALEAAAGRSDPVTKKTELATDTTGDGEKTAKLASAPKKAAAIADFGDDLVRWAKLPPPLTGTDLGPYLHLAAAFTGRALLDEGLPERLRDLGANLVSSVRAEQKSVSDDDLRALNPADALSLLQHLGRVVRDRPTEQVAAVLGLLRVTRLHESVRSEAPKLLAAIPATEVQPATPLHFQDPEYLALFPGVLERWQKKAVGATKNALDTVLSKGQK
jgi:predicted KAP-like P-loop ATPase